MKTPFTIRATRRPAVAWLALGAVLALSGCSVFSNSNQGPTGLRFTPCADMSSWAQAPLPDRRRYGLDVGCASLTVPIDHAEPAHGSLDVAVMRVRATDA